jgi:hypothetical protein
MSFTNWIRNYFDLRQERIAQVTGTQKHYVAPQYFTLVIGVVAQPFLDWYIQHGSWEVEWEGLLGRLVFGCLVGIAIFPGVYKNSLDNSSPLFPQLCTIFTGGLGWQTLFASAVKGVSHVIQSTGH